MRSSTVLAAAFTALVAAAPIDVPDAGLVLINIANVTAKNLANNSLSFDFDVLDNTFDQAIHCSNTWHVHPWASDDTVLTPVNCSVAGYSFTVRFPNNSSGIQTWSALIGIEGRENWYKATLDTLPSYGYTCAHSGEEGVLSTCVTNPELRVGAGPVAPVLPPAPPYPEIEITNVSAKTLTNNNLIFEFDVIDNTNNETTHCINQMISGQRSVLENACSVAGYTSDIDFLHGFNIQSWTIYIDVEGKPTVYKAEVATGTPDYTCGHSGTEGVLSACFTGAGVNIPAARWSIWGPSS